MKVLVVDDDSNMTETVKSSLAAHAHTVDVSPDGSDGLFLAKSYEYDAIVLDYSLPRKDGLTVCRDIRTSGKKTPILFISNTHDVETKVAAFKAGADDYVTKPFSMQELEARLGALVRRAPEMKGSVLRVDNVALDTENLNVTRNGARLHLTRKEFNMLEYFMKNPGRVLSRAQIMEHIWTADGNPFSNTVEAHIRNLRKKLGDPNLISNVAGRGYIFDCAENLKKLGRS